MGKTNAQRREDLKARLAQINEKIEADKAAIDAQRKAGTIDPKTAKLKLKELLQSREAVQSELANLQRKSRTQAEIVLGGITDKHFQEQPAEPLEPRQMLEALKGDPRTWKNADLFARILRLFHKVFPDGTSFQQWAAPYEPQSPFLWSKPTPPRPKRKAPEPPNVPDPLPTPPASTPQAEPFDLELEIARKSRDFCEMLLTRTEESWRCEVVDTEKQMLKALEQTNKRTILDERIKLGDTHRRLDADKRKLQEIQSELTIFHVRTRKNVESALNEIDAEYAQADNDHEKLVARRTEEHDSAVIWQKAEEETKKRLPGPYARLVAVRKIHQDWIDRDGDSKLPPRP